MSASLTPEAALASARALEAADPLARFRDQFVAPPAGLIYLNGNSLGPLPRSAAARAREVVEEGWGARLVRGWSAGWWSLPEHLGDLLAPLLGAGPGEVVVADSTSVNLFRLAAAALRARPERSVLLTDDRNFPSDLYVLHAAARAVPGCRVEVLPAGERPAALPGLLRRALHSGVALVALTHADFRHASLYPLEEVTAEAHAAGAWMLWDLSHSAGVVPVELARHHVELAVGCTYKYLCGGPGAPAYLYVRSDLQAQLENPLAGWAGHAAPFAFSPSYEPAAGIRHFLTGTPPVISMALIEAGISLLRDAGVAPTRERSLALGNFLLELYSAWLAPAGYRLRTPREADRRGAHVALEHPEARRIQRELLDEYGVVVDLRPPDLLRLGIHPLYNTFQELCHAAVALQRAAVNERLGPAPW